MPKPSTYIKKHIKSKVRNVTGRKTKGFKRIGNVDRCINSNMDIDFLALILQEHSPKEQFEIIKTLREAKNE